MTLLTPPRPRGTATRLYAACVCVLVLAPGGAVWAQSAWTENDPRLGLDPREGNDPRDGLDPRDLDSDPREAIPEPRERLVSHLELGLDNRIQHELLDAPWEAAVWLEPLVDRWLSTMHSKPEGSAPAPSRLEKAEQEALSIRHVSQLADRATGDTRYRYWTDTVLEWSAEQVRDWHAARELSQLGDSLAGNALDAADALNALSPYRRALGTFTTLGDTRGRAQMHLAIGDVLAEVGQAVAGEEHLRTAERLARELRLEKVLDEALRARYVLTARLERWEDLVPILSDQSRLAFETGDANRGFDLTARQIQLELMLDGQKAEIQRIVVEDDDGPEIEDGPDIPDEELELEPFGEG